MKNIEKTQANELETFSQRSDFLNTAKARLLDNYPFVHGEIEEIEKKFINLSSRINVLDDEKLLNELREIILSLDNSHTVLVEKETGINLVAQHPIKHVEDRYWLEKGGQWLEVLTLDGRPIGELIDEMAKEIPGGTQNYKKEAALFNLLSAQTPRKIQTTLDDEGKQVEFELNYQPAGEPAIKSVVCRIIGEVGYLAINTWAEDIKVNGQGVSLVEVLDQELEKINETKAIIIDVRENGGGQSKVADQFAGRFISEEHVYSVCKGRGENPSELVTIDTKSVKPRGKQLSQQLIILTGPKCLSSNEMFIASLKDSGRAKTIGGNAGGGSGKPEKFLLDLGSKKFDLSISTWRQYRLNGQEIERQGIEPDIEVRQTVEDLKAGKDTVLETAIDYLSKKQ